MKKEISNNKNPNMENKSKEKEGTLLKQKRRCIDIDEELYNKLFIISTVLYNTKFSVGKVADVMIQCYIDDCKETINEKLVNKVKI